MADDPPASLLAAPHVRLSGEVNESWLDRLLDGLGKVPDEDEVVGVEVTTKGGDAEIARRLVLEVDLARERLKRRLAFIGKTQVYSAGATLMAAFPKQDRFLTQDSVLLIHCRQLEKTIQLSGPLRSSLPELRAAQEQIENGLRLEEGNFRRLVEGSDVSFEEVNERALSSWYLTADEALGRGLIGGILSREDKKQAPAVRAA